jgi:hypothetical protein
MRSGVPVGCGRESKSSRSGDDCVDKLFGLAGCLDGVRRGSGVLVSEIVAILSLEDDSLSGVPLSEPPKSVSLLRQHTRNRDRRRLARQR